MDDKDRSIGPGSRLINRAIDHATTPATTTFASAADAAKDAIRRFNPQSIKEGLEYGGTIYRVARTGRFAYVDTPNVQSIGFSGGHVSTEQAIPAGAIDAGRWHTHGRTLNFTDEEFSKEDLGLAWERRLPSWLGTPKGAIKQAVPTKAGAVILDVEPSEGLRPNIRFVPS